MRDREATSLVRAAAALLVASSLRWGAQLARHEADLRPPTPPEHLAATDSATEAALRASLPLAPGERVDPNRADAVELDRLPGIGPATASAIVSAREAGEFFAAAGDLEKVRGIGPSTALRLEPFLDFTRPPPPGSRSRSRGSAHQLVDVNTADPDELQTLPGIGPVMARRIVEERTRRSFATLSELTRVQGIGEATVSRLRGAAVVGSRR